MVKGHCFIVRYISKNGDRRYKLYGKNDCRYLNHVVSSVFRIIVYSRVDVVFVLLLLSLEFHIYF